MYTTKQGTNADPPPPTHTHNGSNIPKIGAQCLSDRVLDSRPKDRGFEPYRRHCIVSLSKNINPSLVLVQPTLTCPALSMSTVVSFCLRWNDVESKVQPRKPHSCKIVDWDVKNQIKPNIPNDQTKLTKKCCLK